MKNNGNKKLIILLAILALLGIAGTAYFGVKSNQQASIARLSVTQLNSGGRGGESTGALVESLTNSIARGKSYYTLAFSDGQGGYTCHVYNLTKNELKKKKFDGNHVTQVECP